MVGRDFCNQRFKFAGHPPFFLKILSVSGFAANQLIRDKLTKQLIKQIDFYIFAYI